MFALLVLTLAGSGVDVCNFVVFCLLSLNNPAANCVALQQAVSARVGYIGHASTEHWVSAIDKYIYLLIVEI